MKALARPRSISPLAEALRAAPGLKTGSPLAGSAAIGKVADAAVVGSAIVSRIAESLDESSRATEQTVPAALDLVRALASGMRGKVPA